MTRDVLEFYRGETWAFTFTVRNAAGAAVDMTSGSLKFRLADAAGAVISKTWAAALIMPDPTTGQGAFAITAADQASVVAKVYEFELQATLPDSTVSTQSYGTITVLESLYKRFP